MFASQVALVVANVRRHRDEERAKAGLGTLIETSPVGVVVFDAMEGAPVSFNREAIRIVGGLLNPDQTTEQLADVLTVRRADGSELSLAEFPPGPFPAIRQVGVAHTRILLQHVVPSEPDTGEQRGTDSPG